MRWMLSTLIPVISLASGSALAQKAEPPAEPSPSATIVRVRNGHSSGMCAGGYCFTETVIEAGSIRSVSASSPDKKKFPDRTFRYRIAKRDWEDLQHFIDAKVLAAFTGRVGCPGCVDRPETWMTVEFSDGTKKSVGYNFSDPPPEIVALLKKIQDIKTFPLPQHK